MNISKEMRGILVDELRFVVEKMRESEEIAEKLYFYSAAYGAVHRVMNVEYDWHEIYDAMILAVDNNNLVYGTSPYGDGQSSKRIVNILKNIVIDNKLINKRITY